MQTVEDLGFDSYWRSDHPLLTPDCWTTLAAVAASTRRLRLGSMVSCVFYRNPVLLARIVADVDRVSGGRVILGLGAGDMEQSFAPWSGVPAVRERQAALAESLQIVGRLLRGQTVTYQGAHCRVEGVTLQPPPVQQPSIPLVVAGGGEQTTLRLVAQYAHASNLAAEHWDGAAATNADVRRKYDVLQAHCASFGLQGSHCS
ncbi:MAG: LLM class flavin-dependent oxidoreductase [Chloroflexota bacterium]|nr:LLM class flavin-dependent oxidoreductase [Chloroflexota bacterium]